MKMKLIDRILMGLYALLLTLLLVVIGFCALDPLQAQRVAGLFAVFMNSVWIQAAAVVIVLVLIAGLIRLMALPFLRERPAGPGSVSLQNTDSGTVRVSVSAMDTLVQRAVSEAEGVLEYTARILNNEDSVTVEIDIAVAADASIPNVTMLMQRDVKRCIEETAGIAVREVVILVTEILEPAVLAIAAPEEAPVVIEEEPAEPAEPSGEDAEEVSGTIPEEAEPEISVETSAGESWEETPAHTDEAGEASRPDTGDAG